MRLAPLLLLSILLPACGEQGPGPAGEVLFDGVGTFGGVTLRDGFVYTSDKDAGTISRTPVAGGSPEVLVSDLEDPGRVLVDAEGARLFWTSFDGGQVLTAGLDGGDAAVFVDERTTPTSLVSDGTALYWVDLTAEQIWTVPLAGGDATMVVDEPDGPRGVWTAPGEDSLWYTVRGDTATDGEVHRIPKAGGEAQVLVGELAIPQFIDGNERRVFWTDEATWGFHSAALDGGSPEVHAEGRPGRLRVAAVEGGAYYSTEGTIDPNAPVDNYTDGELGWTNGSGESELIASDLSRPWHLAADEEYVVWADVLAGALMALPR